MLKWVTALAGIVIVAAVVNAVQRPDPGDVLAQIRAEGLERSRASDVFETLTIDIGGRLTASPAHRRAVEYVRERLTAYGLANVHLDGWKFGRGWKLDQISVDMIEPRYLPLVAYADGWSPATPGDIVATPIFIGGQSIEQVQAMRDRLKGSIVMTQPIMTNFVRRDRPQPSAADYVAGSAGYATSAGRNAVAPQASQTSQGRGTAGRGQAGTNARGRGNSGPSIAQVLRDAGAAVLLKPSIGEHGTVFVTGRDQGPGAVPSVTLSGEHYNMIARLLARNIPVRLRVNLRSTFYENDGTTHNVIAELPGADPAVRDEIVMIGAHLDSWHTADGATDNADGATTVIEAMRILKAIGAQPRRTIRVALWAGEEQGLLGSRSWVERNLAGEANRTAREKFNVYFNIDNGYGPIYGFYLQNNLPVRSMFDSWIEPLATLGVRRNVDEAVGSTDHLSFVDVGLPGFNPIQEYGNYDIRTHHTNMDTVERLNVTDLRQAAIVMATFAYNAAMVSQKIPRPR